MEVCPVGLGLFFWVCDLFCWVQCCGPFLVRLVEALNAFLDLIYSSKVRRGEEDQICWKYTKSGLFQVKYMYKVLCYGGGSDYPWKSIWRAKFPLKVAFFIWTAVLGRILFF